MFLPPSECCHQVLNLQFDLYFFSLSSLIYLYIWVTMQQFFSSCSKKTFSFQELQESTLDWDATHLKTFFSVLEHPAQQDLFLFLQVILLWFPWDRWFIKPLLGSFFVAHIYPSRTVICWIIFSTDVPPQMFLSVWPMIISILLETKILNFLH